MDSKRLMDVLVASGGLVAVFPLLAGLGLLIRLDSRGPALFRQQRVGLGGREFTFLKLRTMHSQEHNVASKFEPGDTSRVTRFGRLLRRTKLDELPQLWNVLVGDMSLVGPRPEVPDWVAIYPERWAKVHMLRPGVTDPASLAFADEESLLASAKNPRQCYREVVLPAKLDLYERYVEHHTLVGDLVILAQTLILIGGRMLRIG